MFPLPNKQLHSLSRFSTGYGLAISPIQKKPKTCSYSSFNSSFQTPNTNVVDMISAPYPYNTIASQSLQDSLSYFRNANTSQLSPSSHYYPANSRSHLPLSHEMYEILKDIFNCADVDCGRTKDLDEVSLTRFIDDVKNNSCIPIVCGVHQHNDLLQALSRINQTQLAAATPVGQGVWLSWTNLITHLESVVTPSNDSIAFQYGVQQKIEKQRKKLLGLQQKRQYNQMQRDWGKASKEEYYAMLADQCPELYGEGRSGGGGAVFSKQTLLEDADGRDEGKTEGKGESEEGEGTIHGDTSDSKASEYFRDIQLQLANLDIALTNEDAGHRDRLGVSARIEEQMARKEETDAAAAKDMARHEAELSLEGEGEEEDVVAGRVAMRLRALPADEVDAVDR